MINLEERPFASSEASTTCQRQPHQSRLYDNLVPAYQALWPAVARRRIERNVLRLNIPPRANVLEVGVGTGLSLRSYPYHARVMGVDLSESMLAEA
ncbi:MAG: class I SAM-dependent methyltransferase, partial [Planctomycetota bacterium]